jgi:hypothetical protein
LVPTFKIFLFFFILVRSKNNDLGQLNELSVFNNLFLTRKTCTPIVTQHCIGWQGCVERLSICDSEAMGSDPPGGHWCNLNKGSSQPVLPSLKCGHDNTTMGKDPEGCSHTVLSSSPCFVPYKFLNFGLSLPEFTFYYL